MLAVDVRSGTQEETKTKMPAAVKPASKGTSPAPPKIIMQLFKHPLTDAGIAGFLKDWQASGQQIG